MDLIVLRLNYLAEEHTINGVTQFSERTVYLKGESIEVKHQAREIVSDRIYEAHMCDDNFNPGEQVDIFDDNPEEVVKELDDRDPLQNTRHIEHLLPDEEDTEDLIPPPLPPTTQYSNHRTPSKQPTDDHLLDFGDAPVDVVVGVDQEPNFDEPPYEMGEEVVKHFFTDPKEHQGRVPGPKGSQPSGLEI